MNKYTKTVARRILKVYEDPAHFTQYVYARDTSRNSLCWDDPKAVCWCLSGQLQLQIQKLPMKHRFQVVLDFQRLTAPRGIVFTNDVGGLPTVREFLQKVINT